MIRCTIIKRPSAIIKSPYVADVILDNGETVLLHTPGLGCCGLVESGRIVYAIPSKSTAKTDFIAQLAECEDNDGKYFVGIHPFVSQNAALQILPTIDSSALWSSEVTVAEGTRLDFVGHRNDGKMVYVEIKTAMVSLENEKPRSYRRAVFPEGYRKKKGDSCSERANKHCSVLCELLKKEDTEACHLIFMIPRSDCGDGMEINKKDPYYNYCLAAIQAGVKVRAFSLHYDLDGSVKVGRQVPVYI
jgi:DNA-binding sugar fermentation-stimulating protein